jgi:hypothetical protein
MDLGIRGEEKSPSFTRDKKFTSEVMTLKLKFSMNWKENMGFSQRPEELLSLEYPQAVWLS